MANESSAPDEKERRTGAKDTADASAPPHDVRTSGHGGMQGGIGAAAPPDATLPHERDQSPGDAGDAPRGEGREAYEDARRGRPDTSKSEAMDRTYHELRKKQP